LPNLTTRLPWALPNLTTRSTAFSARTRKVFHESCLVWHCCHALAARSRRLSQVIAWD
jgi:hypothetical protein